MDQSDGAMAVVASLRRSGRVTHADLRHRGPEKKRPSLRLGATRAPAEPRPAPPALATPARRRLPPAGPLGTGSVVGPPSPPRPPPAAAPRTLREKLRGARAVFRPVPGTLRPVWDADRRGTALVALLTAILALLPAGIAWVGKLIVDGVVLAARSGLAADRERVLWLVAGELLLMAIQLSAGRLLSLRRELLRGVLGNRVNERILEKALELELRHFEDADVYDKMQNARREASARPLSLVMQAFAIAQNTVTLVALSGLLLRVSPASVLVVVAASVPAFLAEARLSADSRASARKAGTDAATTTRTLAGDTRRRSPERATSVTVFCAIANACITSDSGRAEASRRAFCILS